MENSVKEREKNLLVEIENVCKVHLVKSSFDTLLIFVQVLDWFKNWSQTLEYQESENELTNFIIYLFTGSIVSFKFRKREISTRKSEKSSI